MNVPALRRFYWKLEKAVVPELRSSQYHYRDKLLSVLPKGKCRWLDLGCGHQVFADWMMPEQQELLSRMRLAVGIDLDVPSLKAHTGLTAKFCANLTQIPFRDNSFDVITANMVVEHLDQPEAVFRQVHRLLSPGGIFVFHTTNARNPLLRTAAMIPQGLKNRVVYLLEHRKPEDIFPTHYRANRPDDIRSLADKASFEVCSLDLVSTSAFSQMLGPLVLFELLFIRALRSPRLQHLRTNIICVLRKNAAAPGGSQSGASQS
jgi:ubiquinone/menaquinone biosynthesis C-methylase UbiE